MRAKGFLRSIVPAAFAAHAAFCSIAEPGRAAERQKTCGELMKDASDSDRDTKCIAMAGSVAASRDGALILRMDDGTRKVFKSADDGAGYGWALLDFYPATHVFVIGDIRDDDTLHFLVDGRTGRKIPFGSAYPSPSPSARFILSEKGNDPNDSSATRFAILDISSPDKPKTVWRGVAGKGSIPAAATFGAWEDDMLVRLDSASKAPLFLSRGADGTWRVSASRPTLQQSQPGK